MATFAAVMSLVGFTSATLGTSPDFCPDYWIFNGKKYWLTPSHLDGVAGWFDCQLVDDIRMTNSPLSGTPLARPQAVRRGVAALQHRHRFRQVM